MISAREQYYCLLRQVVFSDETEYALADSSNLGRRLFRQDVPPEKLIDIHHGAVLRLAREHPGLPLALVADRLSAPLMEVTMTYSMAFRQQVEQKYSDMMQARLAQSSKLESLGTLAAGIAHDFNTLLGVINGYAELAGDALEDGSDGKQCLEHIAKATFRARDLIARMLAFARQQPATPVSIDPASVVADALQMLSVSLPSSLALSFEADIDGVTMVADPTQLQQIVINLCVNAADAMGTQGRLRVTLCRSAPPGQHTPWLHLAVTDTGHGMPPEVCERIFDPFFTTKEPGRGSGLGLSIVFGIVATLQGEIDVSSKVGAGTRFDVWLPLVPASVPDGETP